MTYGIRFVDVPDGIGLPIRLINPWSGYWLERFDADAFDGLGEAAFSGAEGDAIRFDTIEQAKELWSTQSTVRPAIVGSDGIAHENRPLMPVSIHIDELE